MMPSFASGSARSRWPRSLATCAPPASAGIHLSTGQPFHPIWKPAFASSPAPKQNGLRRDLGGYLRYYETDRARTGRPTRGRTRESVLGKAKMWPLSRGCVGRSRNKEDTLGAGRRRAPRTVRVDGCGTLQSRIASPARVRKLRRRRFTAPGESGSGHYARRALPTRSRARWNAAASAATGRSAA